MATNTSKTRANEVGALQKLSDGLTQQQATLPAFTVGGVPMKAPDIVAKILGQIALSNAVLPARDAWQTAVDNEQAGATALKPIVAAVRQTLLASYPGQVDTLGKFGLTPRKKPVVSPATRAAAAIKAKATRAARGTKGTQQKAAITTQVTVAPAAPTAVKVDGAGANPVVVTGAPAPAPATAGAGAAGNAASTPAGTPGVTAVPAVHSIP